MVYKIVIFLLFCSATWSAHTEPVVLDEILAVLPHADGDIVILASDIQLSLGGEQRSFRSVILDGLMVLKARDMKLNVPEAAVDSFITSLQKQNRCTLAELNEQFEQVGFSMSEMRDIIKRRRLVEELMGVVVRINEPSKEEITTYRQEHPILTEAAYTIRLGFLDREEVTPDTVKALQDKSHTLEKVRWSDPENYMAGNLTENQTFITTMQPLEVRLVEEHEDGLDLIQLVAVTPETSTPLDETTALYELKEKLYMDALEEFQEKLLKTATIRFCRDEDALRELLEK